jgi:hypothetical protein
MFRDQFRLLVIGAAVVAVAAVVDSVRAQCGETACNASSNQACCADQCSSRSGCGSDCWRCRKTLLHWPCQDFSYVSADDEEEPLATDRPDFTEASSTVGLGRTQLEFGYTYVRDDEAGVELRGDSYPELLTRVGMFAEWFEFRIAWNYAHERISAAGIVDSVDGAEDLYLGCKIALFEQDGWLPELAIVPQMTVPTGARAFTTDEVMPGVNLLYGWDITDELSFAGSTQGNRALDASGDFYEEYAQSLTVAVSLTERIGIYNEVFGFFPHGAVETGPEYYYNGGFTYLVNNNFQLDVRAGWGLNDRSDDFFTGAGGAVRF